jgi:hypothetical protein
MFTAGSLDDCTLPADMRLSTTVVEQFAEAGSGWYPITHITMCNTATCTHPRQYPVRGSCSCGSCAFTLEKLPKEFQHCHCSWCRKQHGAPFATYGPIERGLVAWTGTSTLITTSGAGTSKWAQRTACEQCGSTLTLTFLAQPDTVWIAIGALDDASLPTDQYKTAQGVEAVRHINVRSKARWYCPPDDGLQRCHLSQ